MGEHDDIVKGAGVRLLHRHYELEFHSGCSRVAEVVPRHKGPLPKSLDSNETFKPKHTLFARIGLASKPRFLSKGRASQFR